MPRKKKQDDFITDQDPSLESLGDEDLGLEVLPDEGDGTSESTPAKGKGKSKGKDDPSNRIRDLQSTNDKLRSEIKKLEPLVPIGDLIGKHSEKFAKFVEDVKESEGPPKLEAPKAPERPRDFDEAESFTEPESTSYRYRQEKDDYMMRRLEFQDKKAEAQLAYIQKLEQGRVEKEKENAAEVQLRTKLAAAGVVGEAVIAYEMANAMMEKFGGDNLDEMKRNFDAYQEYVKSF